MRFVADDPVAARESATPETSFAHFAVLFRTGAAKDFICRGICDKNPGTSSCCDKNLAICICRGNSPNERRPLKIRGVREVMATSERRKWPLARGYRSLGANRFEEPSIRTDNRHEASYCLWGLDPLGGSSL